MNEVELSDKDLKGYLAARSFTRAIGEEIVSNIKVGMTETEVEEVASLVFNKNGVKQNWHMPVIGVGQGSTKLKSAYALASRQKFPESGLNYLLFGTRGPFITSGNNTLMNGLWVIEPYIMCKDRAAKFEQLVFIGKETVIL